MSFLNLFVSIIYSIVAFWLKFGNRPILPYLAALNSFFWWSFSFFNVLASFYTYFSTWSHLLTFFTVPSCYFIPIHSLKVLSLHAIILLSFLWVDLVTSKFVFLLTWVLFNYWLWDFTNTGLFFFYFYFSFSNSDGFMISLYFYFMKYPFLYCLGDCSMSLSFDFVSSMAILDTS